MSKKLLEESVGKELLAQGLTIACAESCTGGLLTSRLTDIAGSSAYVMGSVVSYTNRIKESLVGVRHETLLSHGAVSEETAREDGYRRRHHWHRRPGRRHEAETRRTRFHRRFRSEGYDGQRKSLQRRAHGDQAPDDRHGSRADPRVS